MAGNLEEDETLFMNCSIVIRAYNEDQHIGRLLEGIRHQTLKDVDVILVDSGSTDSTIAIAESYGAKVVRIPSTEFTFGRSLNYGIKASKREFIVIASAHVSHLPRFVGDFASSISR
jgi:rhamnosyltransferase